MDSSLPWTGKEDDNVAGKAAGQAERAARQAALLPLDWLLSGGVALAAFALYFRTMLPTVGIGDTAEFQYAISMMTVPHPTGYPLYVLIGKLFTFLPFGTEAYRINLMSAVCGALAVGMVYLMARLVGAGRVPAVAGALAFAAAPINWYWSTIAKTYTLHVLLVGLAFVLFALWARGKVHLGWVALAIGLSFANHRGSTLLIPAYLLFWYLIRRPKLRDLVRLRYRPSVWVIAGLLLPQLTYLYIPIRGIPGYNGFWETLNYGASGSSLIAQIRLMSRDPVWAAGDYFLNMLPQQFGALTLIAIAGLALLALGFPKRAPLPARLAAVLLGAGWLGILAFHIPVYGGDITGFMLPTFWMLAVCLAAAIEDVVRFVSGVAARVSPVARKFTLPVTSALAAVLAVAIGPAAIVRANFPHMDLSGDYTQERRATELLNALEPNAVLVLNDDWLQIWQLKYQRYVAGVRPDTIVVDGQNAEPILRESLAAHRPAYSMQYAPGLAAERRLIPVMAFWKALEKPVELAYHGTVDADFSGTLRLTGWSAPSRTAVPGEVLPVYLNWEAQEDLDTDYVVFTHLLDLNGKSPVGWDSQPMHAETATSTWKRGQKMEDPHGLLLPADLPPGRYSLEVGIYPLGSTARIKVQQLGAPEADRVLIGPFRVGIGTQQVSPHSATNTPLTGLGTLLGYDIGTPTESSLPVTLYWKAGQKVDQDYTITVQVLSAAGKLVAQHDSQPAGGTYPTSIWEPGDIVPDSHAVNLDTVPAGEYRVIVAVYGPGGKRLQFGGQDYFSLGLIRLP